jgi:hypothetical protein
MITVYPLYNINDLAKMRIKDMVVKRQEFKDQIKDGEFGCSDYWGVDEKMAFKCGVKVNHILEFRNIEIDVLLPPNKSEIESRGFDMKKYNVDTRLLGKY